MPCPYQSIVDLYHEKLESLPRVRVTTADRERAMRKRWAWVLSSTKANGRRRATSAEEALAWLADFFERASRNDWLMGRTERSAAHAGWKCDLDFLLSDKGLKAVVERTEAAA